MKSVTWETIKALLDTYNVRPVTYVYLLDIRNTIVYSLSLSLTRSAFIAYIEYAGVSMLHRTHRIL